VVVEGMDQAINKHFLQMRKREARGVGIKEYLVKHRQSYPGELGGLNGKGGIFWPGSEGDASHANLS